VLEGEEGETVANREKEKKGKCLGSWPLVLADHQTQTKQHDQDEQLEWSRQERRQEGADIPVPVDFTLHNISEGQRVLLLLNGFFITWTSKYELKRGPDTVLALHVQRQQGVQSKMDYLIVKPAAVPDTIM
jgi:hypothetical protein